MLPLTLEYIGKWRDLPSQETCQREVSTIMGGDSSVISRSACMWGFCLWCVTFSEEIWTDIWSLRIGFQQQIEVTIPLKSSLFSQWVCWAYIQSMDERLLAGALVTQTKLLTKKTTQCCWWLTKITSLECPAQFTGRTLVSPLHGNCYCLGNGFVKHVNFIFPRLGNCVCFPSFRSLPFPSKKKYFS